MRPFLFHSAGPDVSGREASFSARLAWLYAALFIMGGIQLPFFPVWLKAKGLDANMIGFILAAPMLARVAGLPIIMHAADRHDAVRGTIVATSILTVLGYAAMGLFSDAAAILVTMTLASIAATAVMPLTEAYALRGLSARGRAYGPVRLWGSLTFIAGVFAAGFTADLIAPRHLIWLIAAAALFAAIVSAMLAPLSTGSSAPTADAAPAQRMLRDPAFMAVVAAASLIQASHAVYYGFSAVAWSAAGLDGTMIAALWALGVVGEIILFAYSARLPSFFRPTVMLMIGAAGGALRWGLMAFDPPAMALPFLQLLHGLSFGATHLGTLMFVARTAPQGHAARAQGYLALAMGVVMAGGMGLSGMLYGAFGAKAYAAMALAAIAGGNCAGIAYRAGRVAAL